jgi:tetratricopeptide (TPR) repeat protein
LVAHGQGESNKNKSDLWFMAKVPTTKNLEDGHLSTFEKVIITLCLLLIAAQFISSFFPEERLWGINHLAYFGLPYRFLFLLLALAIFVPIINTKVQNIGDNISGLWKKLPKALAFVLICVACVFVFWIVRTKTHFLGDGYRLIGYVDSGFPVTMRLIVHEWTQPLAVLVHVYFHHCLNLFTPVSGELVYRMSSYLSGILFVFLALLLSREVGTDKFEKLAAFSLVVAMGSTQLFLGYVEHYSWPYVGILAYLLFAFKFLEGKTNIFVPLLIFCGCVAFHFSTLYLLPSFTFLFLCMPSGKRPRTRTILLGAVAVVITVILLMFKLGEKPGEALVPLFEGRYYAPYHTLFSFPHVLDVINEHLLLSPLGLILLITLFIFTRDNGRPRDNVVRFLILVSVFQVLYSFLLDPKLGGPRDWDMFSATALGYTVLAIYLFVKRSKAIFNFRYTTLILMCTLLFSTLPWVLLNASADKSIARFRAILELDPKRSRQGHYLLSQYFGKRGMVQEVVKEDKRQTELFPELDLISSAVSYIRQGKLDGALDLLKQAVQINPYSAEAYDRLARVYTGKGLLTEAVQQFNRAIQLYPYEASYYEGLGVAYHKMGLLDKSIQSYEKAKDLNPDNPSMCYYQLGALYGEKGLLDEAILWYERALALEPDFFAARLNLGVAYIGLGKMDQAILSLEYGLRIQPENARAHYILGTALARKGLSQKAAEHFQRYLDLSTDTTDQQRVRDLLEYLKSQ